VSYRSEYLLYKSFLHVVLSLPRSFNLNTSSSFTSDKLSDLLLPPPFNLALCTVAKAPIASPYTAISGVEKVVGRMLGSLLPHLRLRKRHSFPTEPRWDVSRRFRLRGMVADVIVAGGEIEMVAAALCGDVQVISRNEGETWALP
jgi:hypothetical protein